MSITPLNNAVLGTSPIAINTPAQSIVVSAPVTVSRTRTPVTSSFATSRISTTSLFHTGLIFGFASTRSAMIFDARSESRR